MRSSSDIEQVMDSYSDAVWRACLVYLAPSEAEDIFQNTFMKYALHEAPFRDEEHKKAWLIRVAINACKDVLKAKNSQNESLEGRAERDQNSKGVFGVANGSGIFSAVSSETSERSASDTSLDIALLEILDAFNSLDDPPKTELYLSLYEGYTAKEISVMTGEPEGTVYSWISRGKKLLQEALR